MGTITTDLTHELAAALATIADQQLQIARLQQDAIELRNDNQRLKDQVYGLLSLRHGSAVLECSKVVPQEAE